MHTRTAPPRVAFSVASSLAVVVPVALAAVPTPLQLGAPIADDWWLDPANPVPVTVHTRMRPMCAFRDVTTAETMAHWAALYESREFLVPVEVVQIPEPVEVAEENGDATPGDGGGIDVEIVQAFRMQQRATSPEILLRFFGDVPIGASAVFVEAIREFSDRFEDPVTYRIDVFFDDTSFGAASTEQFANVPYSLLRDALIADMDADDVVQEFLPSGSSLPARFTSTGGVGQVSQTTVLFPVARALGLQDTGGRLENPNTIDAFLFIGTDNSGVDPVLDFTTTPESGILPNGFSALDIITHEIGHTLGFTSDLRGPVSGRTSPENSFSIDPTAVDLFRFRNTETPTTLEAFRTTPRYYDNSGDANGRHVWTDTFEFQSLESDVAFQASHWRDTFSGARGIMEAAIGPNLTRSPNLLSASDLAAWDAIGWDVVESVPCAPADLVTPFGELPTAADTSEALARVQAGVVSGDFDANGSTDFGDVVAYLQEADAGCS